MLTPVHTAYCIYSYIIEYEWTSAALCLGLTIYFLSWFYRDYQGCQLVEEGYGFMKIVVHVPYYIGLCMSSKLEFSLGIKLKKIESSII